MSDHLDIMDEQLKDLEDTLQIAANAMAAAPDIIRKSRARIRALRRESAPGSYRVTWQRHNEDSTNVCNGLTPELAVARIIQAIEFSGGPILVHKVEKEEESPCPTS